MSSEGCGEESETASVDPIPHQGDHKRFLLSWPIPGRCLEKRHPFGSKKSNITCGISFGVCGEGVMREKRRGEGRGEKEEKKGLRTVGGELRW